MNEVIIIGSGFSSFVIAQKIKRFKPIIISQNSIDNRTVFLRRKNLLINKLLGKRSLSFGNFKYIFNNNTKLHDRLSFGGNTNVWGGFIDIESLKESFVNDFTKLGINFTKLDQNTNGYKSNVDTIRQLRNGRNKILDASDFISQNINGFVNTISVKDENITVNYLDNNNKNCSMITKKLFLGIGFSQLIDLLFRSKLLNKNVNIKLNEFAHQFIINFDKKNFKGLNEDRISIKYDLLRAIKHYLGYQYSLDKLKLFIPIFVDQNFYYKKKIISLDLNLSENLIHQIEGFEFGNSIHYCNLTIDDEKIEKYINNISPNIIGVSVPFINQKKPGPISNDIVNNIWNTY